MNYKQLRKLNEKLTRFLDEERLNPYKFTIDYGDGRPEGIIEYGKDEEDARTNLLKTHKYLQGKEQRITNIEEVPEDHEEVTEDFMMIHQSGAGPDASGEVKFFPTAFGYEYECTEEDFNGKGPQWSTIRTIDGIRNWFRNILFEFGAKDVYIGKYHWNINDFPKNESLNEDLKTIWKKEMKRDPIIDTPDGPIYLQPSEDGKSIEFGTMTNNGMIVDGSVEYDFDYSLDTNLDIVYDEIRDYYELYLVPEEDRDQVVTDEKEDRLNSLLDETMERYLEIVPIEGGFIPNTNIEYDSELILKEGDKVVGSIMFEYNNETDDDIRNMAKDYFNNITKDIKVKWVD